MAAARRSLRLVLSLLVALPLLALGGGAATARSALPSLRLITASDRVEVSRYGHGRVYIDFGAYVADATAPLEIHVWRTDYHSDPQAALVLRGHDGPTIRALPDAVVDRYLRGIRGFFRLKLVSKAGKLVTDRVLPFCPNGWDVQRVDPSGPLVPTYPYSCTGNPFAVGMVWGLNRGWAAPAVSTYETRFFLDDGRYFAFLSIRNRYRRLFHIPRRDAKVEITVDVSTSGDCGYYCGGVAPRVSSETTDRTILTPAPRLHLVDRRTMPDLIALPAFSISTRRNNKRDLLSFGANVWNRGPSPLVVEGYREPGEELMHAYQYFLRGDEVVGRKRVGKLEFDDRDGHEHWHFRQFASYRLLDDSKRLVVRSKKEAFCLAPTDQVDMLAPNAVWRPYSIGLETACGGPTALWIRETLPVGWGDTYYQWLPGQSFDITDVPNGTYFIKVRANPAGVLYDRYAGNDVRLRKVILKGTPGHRKVAVPPWHGIDTDGR